MLLFQYCVQRLMSSIADHEYWKNILVGEQCSLGIPYSEYHYIYLVFLV